MNSLTHPPPPIEPPAILAVDKKRGDGPEAGIGTSSLSRARWWRETADRDDYRRGLFMPNVTCIGPHAGGLRRTLLIGVLTVVLALGLATGALAAGKVVNVGTPFSSGPPSIAVDNSGNVFVAWANTGRRRQLRAVLRAAGRSDGLRAQRKPDPGRRREVHRWRPRPQRWGHPGGPGGRVRDRRQQRTRLYARSGMAVDGRRRIVQHRQRRPVRDEREPQRRHGAAERCDRARDRRARIWLGHRRCVAANVQRVPPGLATGMLARLVSAGLCRPGARNQSRPARQRAWAVRLAVSAPTRA